MRAARVAMMGALAVLSMLGLATPGKAATNLEPGVYVDPGSPAAKEYALPLNQARGTGQPSSGHGEGGHTLFGAGIRGPGSGGGGRSQPGSTRGDGHSAGGSAGSAQLPAVVSKALHSSGSSGGDGSVLVLIGGGVAVLVLGGFGGTVLRHSRRPDPAP